MRGAAKGRIAPGAGAFDSAKGARAMHAMRDGRGHDRHGPIGRLASSRTGHEATDSEDATAGVCALGVRDLHAFSLHRVRTVLTAAHSRVNEARNFSLSNCSRVVRRMESTLRGGSWGTKMDSTTRRCECVDACGQHFQHDGSAAAQLHQGSACFLWFSNSRNPMSDASFRGPRMRSEHVAARTSQRQAPRMT